MRGGGSNLSLSKLAIHGAEGLNHMDLGECAQAQYYVFLLLLPPFSSSNKRDEELLSPLREAAQPTSILLAPYEVDGSWDLRHRAE